MEHGLWRRRAPQLRWWPLWWRQVWHEWIQDILATLLYPLPALGYALQGGKGSGDQTMICIIGLVSFVELFWAPVPFSFFGFQEWMWAGIAYCTGLFCHISELRWRD